MRIALVGDLHLRNRAPEGRREQDFFSEVQLPKLKQIFDIADSEQCDCILQAGDWWDHPDPSKKLQAECIELLKNRKRPIPVFTVAGQHDMIGHSLSSISRSVLRIMEAAGVVRILNSVPIQFENTYFYGASFGAEVPNPTSFPAILVIHALIGNKKLYPNQIIEHPRAFASKHPNYSLILVGDCHYRFSYSTKASNTFIVNPGCLVRLARNRDENLKPAIYVFDINPPQSTLTEHLLNVKPNTEVFFPMKEIVEREFQFSEFIEQLQKGGEIGINFELNLQQYLDKYNVPRNIRDLISSAMERIVRVEKESNHV
jgi:hypothetical protein